MSEKEGEEERKNRKQVPLGCFTPPPEDPASGEELETLVTPSKEVSTRPHLFNEENTNINAVETPPPNKTSTGESFLPSFLPSLPRERKSYSHITFQHKTEEPSKAESQSSSGSEAAYRWFAWSGLEPATYKLPKLLNEAFMVECTKRGYRRRAGWVLANLMAQWLNTRVLLPETMSVGLVREQVTAQIDENRAVELIEGLKVDRKCRLNDIKHERSLRELRLITRRTKLPLNLLAEIKRELETPNTAKTKVKTGNE